MKKILLPLFVIIISNFVNAQSAPRFNNPGPLTICINGSYYLNPSTTIGTFSSLNSSIATVDSRGYVTGIATGTTEVSLTADGVTATASVTVSLTSSVTISDNTALPNYKFFSNTPQGPVDLTNNGTNNYVGYKGFTYSSQTQPTNTGYYRASKQIGNEAGCPVPFYIIKCDACLPVLSRGQSYGGGIVFYVTDGGTHGLIAATIDQSAQSGWDDAMRLARAYTVGEYTGWYLPSEAELNKLFINKGVIGNLASDPYWSSTESGNTNALLQYFSNGNRYYLSKTTTLAHVRVIRAF